MPVAFPQVAAAAAAAAAPKAAARGRKNKAPPASADSEEETANLGAAAAASSVAAPAAAASASAASSAASSSSAAAFPFSNPNSPALAAFASNPSATGATLLHSIRSSLAAVGTPARAAGQQKYMKSEMAFHGVASPVMRPIFTAAFQELQFDSAAQWRDAVVHLWTAAQFREERYAAIALARSPRFKAFHTDVHTALPMVAHMITTGAWWDHVDDLSANVLGALLRAHPAHVSAELTQWSQGDSLWLRRAAICAQLSSKGDHMDLGLLFSLIRPAIAPGSKDRDSFWIRKAIGWGLRQAARDVSAVPQIRAFIAQHYESLSPLSRREALKHLGGDRGPDAVAAAAAAAAGAGAAASSSKAAKGKGAKKKKQQSSDEGDDESDASMEDDAEEAEEEEETAPAAAKTSAAKRRKASK